jgi:hypothetical protein
MHWYKNLAVNVLKTIFDEKGAKKVQHEFQALGVCDIHG